MAQYPNPNQVSTVKFRLGQGRGWAIKDAIWVGNTTPECIKLYLDAFPLTDSASPFDSRA